MHNFMVMEPSNQSLQEVLGNGVRYGVPRFQRDYAWQQEHWEDLWADIETLAQEQFHYMGYIVLQRKGQNRFDVIDGQQRLVTLSLLILAALQKIDNLVKAGIDASENQKRLELLRSQFVGTTNSVTLQVENKLSLNRNNGVYFKSICTHLKAPTRRSLTSTNRQIRRAFEFFLAKLDLDDGRQIAEKLEQIANGMIFTRIVVQDDLNAYKVFETLNARGVQLSTPDLIRNYIFSVITQDNDVPDETLDELDEKWSKVLEQLGESNFTDFVRYHHNIQTVLTNKRNLFRSVRKLADTPQKAYEYLHSLTEYAGVYGALLNPHDSFWDDDGTTNWSQIRHWLEGFSLKQPFSILMTAYFNMEPQEFIKLVKYLFVLSIRYNVIGGLSTNRQEADNNRIAIKVFSGDYSRASHIKNGPEFQGLYPDDDEFISQFSYHKMPTRQSSKKVRFLLADLERHMGHHVEYGQTSLEHICPYNPDDAWADDFGEGVDDIQDRLGNVILLSKDNLGRKSFTDKRATYADSEFQLARKVAQFDSWDLSNINSYQQWLANQAAATWRVD